MWGAVALASLLLQLSCCYLTLVAARRVPLVLRERVLDHGAALAARNDALELPRGLPVFFFHGVTGYPEEAVHLERALAAKGRALVALSFCPRQCSTQSLLTQVPMAIAQVRSVVASDERFQSGYVFIGHSQGGIMARSVIEKMDDHQVHTLISLAGVQNGVFYGPQQADRGPLQVLLAGFGQQLLPSSVFDFDKYLASHENTRALRGEIQRDLCELVVDEPELQHEYSFVNLARFPAFDDWVKANAFLPVLNNVNRCGTSNETKCEEDKQRRKRNFLKLQAAYFFASPNDGVVAPWQVSLFGRYSEVSSVDEIATKFEQLTIVDMRDTLEYVNDTFGLRSLDERGALFLTAVPGVSHGCWIADGHRVDDPTQSCEFLPLFDKYIAPILPLAAA